MNRRNFLKQASSYALLAAGTVNEVFKEHGITLPLENQTTVTEENRHEQGATIQDKLYHGGISAVMEGVPGGMGDNRTILEIYADRTAYESHLKTPHFQKYKQGTLEMVKELELVDTTPLIPGLKIK